MTGSEETPTKTTTRPGARGAGALIPPVILGVLALVSAVEPLSINMYLSGMPQLGEELGVGQAGAQLTLTFFLAGMAGGQLVAGPASDARGRRGIFLTGTLLLVVSAALAALAPQIWVLYLARLLQGVAAGTAVALARAVAADLVHGPELARVFSLLMLLGGVAPVVGPVLGGLVVDATGWRGVFWVLAVVNLIVAVAVHRLVPETLSPEARRSSGLRPLLTAVGRLLRDRAYLGFTAGFVFSFSTMFAYVSASPFILQEYYGFTPVQYSVIFAVNTSGMFITALVNAGLVRRGGPLPLARIGNMVLLVTSVLLLVAAATDLSRWVVLAGLFVIVSSMGVNLANNSALAISRSGGLSGSASAFMGSAQFIMAGLVSPLVGLVATAGVSQPTAMAAVMVGTALIAGIGIHGGARALRTSGAG